jgi:hypothetical protein
LKVLLLNTTDSPWSGEWAHHKWDLVVDLGWAGASIYREWGKRLGTRVISLYDFQEPIEIFQQVNQLIEVGRNQVVDSLGLDWWELDAAVHYQKLQSLLLTSALHRHLSQHVVELTASRPSLETRVLRSISGQEIKCFESPPTKWSSLPTLLRRAWKLRVAQMLEIAFDKWDSDYQSRRRFSGHKRIGANEPMVLFPSPYVNVSRTVLAYAALLPNRKFLLAATRSSGKWKYPPANVQCASLAAYAVPAARSRGEAQSLLQSWHRVKNDCLAKVEELKWGDRAGLFDHFPKMLGEGLCVRDAWESLLDHEPIHSVLSGDDLNVYTRIPLFLARRRGIRAIYCSHGALDGGLLFKQPYADLFLAKGEMEKDYMVRICRLPEERVVIGAPSSAGALPHTIVGGAEPRAIVFFSQPYEVYSGRAEEAYSEILPRLCELARKYDRKVIIKLHPFESRRDRKRLIRRIVADPAISRVEISNCRLVSELIPQMWFGVSINSSVASECTLGGIPFFNCGWLEPRDCGYAAQFVRFSAGQLLNCPEEISIIPDLIANADLSENVRRRLVQPIDARTLDHIL